MTTQATSSGTVLEAVVASLRARARYNRNEQVAPAAVLWPDRERQWGPLLPSLREQLPALLTLGSHDPQAGTGPAIWLRCVLARTLPGADWDEDEIPILYLPGISRQEFRAVESCPAFLQPLAELQYRGEFWHQLNGKDWTVYAFLKSGEGGLGLDVARDTQTQEALTRALQVLATTPIEQLRGRRLEASDFDALLSGDPVRDMLDWLNQPERMPADWGPERWDAFCARCQSDYSFHPHTDGELTAAEYLSERKPPHWDQVWARFAEAPTLYPNIPALLDRVIPQDLLAVETLPGRNRQAEDTLRQALEGLAQLAPHEAAQQLQKLEKEHGIRRQWVWAQLGQAPLARALAPLSRMACLCPTVPGFSSLDEAARSHTETGWQADAAVLDALHCVRQEADVQVVAAAIRSVYGQWLDESAQRLQKRVAQEGYPGPPAPDEIPSGTCVLFADGLRFDVGKRLAARLEERDLTVRVETRWTALPTVTATAKPALSPVAPQITGHPDEQEFQPVIAGTDKPSTATHFRTLLQENEWVVLDRNETGTPDKRAWTEYGALDRYGHDQGWKLAWRIAEELDGLVDRIVALLEAGWEQVRVQTDHGWLLYPGGLPKQEMPAYLTESRWGRCARLKEQSYYAGSAVAWHWCNEVRVALARGISVFYAGSEYAHGGLSVQECLVPVLTVTADSSPSQSSLEEPVWRGLRCRVSVTQAEPGMRADLRTKPADGASSVAGGGKALDAEGKASLLVEDDSYEGTAVSLVLVDTQERVVARLAATVGGEG